MSKTPEIAMRPEDVPEKLVDMGKRAVGRKYHEDLCACLDWPDACPHYMSDEWESGHEAILLAAVLPVDRAAERAKVAEEIATAHWTGRDPERDRFVDEIIRTVRGEQP